NSFVAQYQDGVHVAYQRTGSKLRNTVRIENNVVGATTTFQKMGKGTASTKARHGKVAPMNVDHSSVTCTLYDYYAADWVDKLDLQKIKHDEKTVLQQAGANALGRKTDELIITELGKSTNYALDGTTGLTKDKVLTAMEMLGDADVPDDGERYAIVGWRQWSQLLDIPEFKDADYVGADDLPWKARPSEMKRWLGTVWMPHSGLTKAGNIRNCFWYHKTAIGHAIGSDVTSDITWHGDHVAWFINNMMSQGSVLIDGSGVVSLRCLEA
ncbi:MAG TPA: phage capsid protein, partial [Candidatus Omnitrophota bacterium]|nr:phage capsid protein [Candidatus Omnitrophota bacterium]